MDKRKKLINELSKLAKLEEKEEFKFEKSANAYASEIPTMPPKYSQFAWLYYRKYEHQGRKDAFNKVLQILQQYES